MDESARLHPAILHYSYRDHHNRATKDQVLWQSM